MDQFEDLNWTNFDCFMEVKQNTENNQKSFNVTKLFWYNSETYCLFSTHDIALSGSQFYVGFAPVMSQVQVVAASIT